MGEALAIAVRRRAERLIPAAVINFWCHVIEGAFATFAGELVSGGVIFPLLAAELGATPAQFGLLAPIGRLAFIAPLILAHRMEAAVRKKRLVLLLGIGQRLPLLFIAISLWALAARWPMGCLIAIACCNLATGFIVSLLVGPWMALIGETIPEHRVGRLFGYRNAISSALSVFAGFACLGIISSFAFPGNFTMLYGASFGFMIVSWLIFGLVDEIPVESAPKEGGTAREYFRSLLGALKKDVCYRRFLVYMGISRLGFAANIYYVYAAYEQPGATAGFIAACLITGTAITKVGGNLLFPKACDLIGYKRTLELGVALHAGAMVTAAMAASKEYFIVVALLSGLGMACQTVAGPAFSLQVSPPGRRVGYSMMSMVALLPVGLTAVPLAGFLVGPIGYSGVFILGAAIVLSGLLVLERCNPISRTAEPAEAAE